MKLSIKELLEATGGELVLGKDLTEKVNISTDTRTISNTDFFLPLSGENFDGHNFINQAVEKNCRGYFTEKKQNQFKTADFIIYIENALEAYLNIASYIRKKINPKIVAITGSSGKTTTKEFVYSVLSTTFNTHKSILNHNNEVGLCQTMLNMPESTEFAVIEMGMRGLKEIELLSKHAEPDVGVITNIGTAHIGKLGSIENIAKAKCEITTSLKDVLIAYEDDLIKKFCNWQGEKLFYGKDFEITRQEEDLTEFVYKDEKYKIPVIGEYNVINSLAAIEIGKLAGVNTENIQKGLLNYVPVGDRGKTIILDNSTKLVVDCYNANPDSVIASIGSITKTYKNLKITLVLGDMAELGDHEEELHRKVGEFISANPVHSVVTVGKLARFIAEAIDSPEIKVESFLNNQEASDFLQKNLETNSVILFKASRCMKLEEIANSLENN